MTAPTPKLGAEMQDAQIEVVANALRRAWQLGQTYWQQADSESWKQQDKSNETRLKFEALMDETRRLLARQPAATGKEATIRDRARWFVRDFSRDVGFAMSDAQTEVMLNLFLRYAAPLTTEASKPAAPSVKVYPQGVMGIPPYSPPGSGSMTVKPNISRNAAIDKGERPSTGSLAFDYARAEVDRKLGVSSNPAPSVERDERGAKVATKRVDIQALRAHADKGWGDDCLVPKSVIAMIAEELEASRAASTTAVEQDERGAFRDTLRAALKSYRCANPSRYLNDDQVDASDSEFVSDLMTYVPVGEKARAASTSADVTRDTPPQSASPTDAQIIEVLKTIDGWAMEHGLCDSTFPKAVAKVRELFSANVAQGADPSDAQIESLCESHGLGPSVGKLVVKDALKRWGSIEPAQPALTDDARDAFILDIAAQTPEKPDYWSSCGQCEHNIERAQDLLDAAQSASESEGK